MNNVEVICFACGVDKDKDYIYMYANIYILTNRAILYSMYLLKLKMDYELARIVINYSN
jgi:hypothetical protein